MGRGKFVWIGLASIAALCGVLALWIASGGDPANPPSADSREYGAWTPTPDAGPVPEIGDPGQSESVSDQGGPPEPAEEQQKRKVDEARIREATENRVLGRPASPFDADRLRGLGFDDEEIAEIRKDFTDFASALRAESETGNVAAGYLLDPDERESRRRMRARYLTDREFDAALFATTQANRVQIVRLRPGARTRKVGLRPGDQILSINGVRVFDLPDFEDGRARREEGQLHDLLVLRGEKLFDVNVQCCRAGWSGMEVTLAPPVPESVEY